MDRAVFALYANLIAAATRPTVPGKGLRAYVQHGFFLSRRYSIRIPRPGANAAREGQSSSSIRHARMPLAPFDIYLVGWRRWDDLERSQQLAAFRPDAKSAGAGHADSLFKCRFSAAGDPSGWILDDDRFRFRFPV